MRSIGYLTNCTSIEDSNELARFLTHQNLNKLGKGKLLEKSMAGLNLAKSGASIVMWKEHEQPSHQGREKATATHKLNIIPLNSFLTLAQRLAAWLSQELGLGNRSRGGGAGRRMWKHWTGDFLVPRAC